MWGQRSAYAWPAWGNDDTNVLQLSGSQKVSANPKFSGQPLHVRQPQLPTRSPTARLPDEKTDNGLWPVLVNRTFEILSCPDPSYIGMIDTRNGSIATTIHPQEGGPDYLVSSAELR